jgi:hypothetical protein
VLNSSRKKFANALAIKAYEPLSELEGWFTHTFLKLMPILVVEKIEIIHRFFGVTSGLPKTFEVLKPVSHYQPFGLCRSGALMVA